MKHIFSALLVFIVLINSTSCSNNHTPMERKARLEVRLTDDPANYDSINIDIRDVQINVTGDDANGWQSLAGVNAGIYNLLDLVNDKDTLLADADIPAGRLHQMRLVLGPNNTVVVDGVTFPLQTPSAQQSGLKLNIQQDITGGILYIILLDFDAAKSVVRTGKDKYILKPVIRTVLNAAGGSIKGFVLPDSVQTSVLAIQGADTVAGTFTDGNGGYLIKGLAAGSYDVHYLPSDTSYNPDSKNGIIVQTGMVTIADTVILQK